MINSVILTGRLTRDPDIRQAGENNVARFTLATDRRYKREGQPTADFISCVAFGKTADFIQKYFTKGMKMELEGRIQTGSYEKDGQRIYTTDVVCENCGFAESKKAAEASGGNDDFVNTNVSADEDTTELPFN